MPKKDSDGTYEHFLPFADSNRIECPKCGNDGADGSITGRSGQYGISRTCTKCKNSWSGGIGVQIADFSEPMPIPGVVPPENRPGIQYTGAPFRDPSKNFSGEEQ